MHNSTASVESWVPPMFIIELSKLKWPEVQPAAVPLARPPVYFLRVNVLRRSTARLHGASCAEHCWAPSSYICLAYFYTPAYVLLIKLLNLLGPYRDEVRDFQLYQSDPSGNYGGWKASAIGANKQGAQNLLKQDYKDTMTTEEGVRLVIKASATRFWDWFMNAEN